MTEQVWYHDKETLAEALANAGSFEALARTSKISASTLKSAANKIGVKSPKKSLAAPEPVDPEEQREINVLKLQLREVKRRLKQVDEGEADADRIVKALDAAAERCTPSFNWDAWESTPSSDKSAQTMTLLFSDLHASEVVSLEETRGINSYDWDTMLARLGMIRNAVLSHRDHYTFPVDELLIFMLGDQLSGDIHEELAITNDRPAAEAVVQLGLDTREWLLSFAEEFPKVRIVGVPGNHPRASKKPSAKLAHNNGDWLYYQFLRALLESHPQFSFEISRGSFATSMICDRWRALLMHGDGIRSSMPGVPWGGVHRRVTTLEQQFSKSRTPLDYVFMGHWHTTNSLDGIQARTFLNGSVKGADEYSLKMFGSGRDASQTLLTFHPKRGWTGQYPCNLQSVQPASEGW